MNLKDKIKEFSKQNNISENQVANLLNLCEQNFDVLKSVVDYYKTFVLPPPADVETFNEYLTESIVWRVCEKMGIEYNRPYVQQKKVSYKDADELKQKNKSDYNKIMRKK